MKACGEIPTITVTVHFQIPLFATIRRESGPLRHQPPRESETSPVVSLIDRKKERKESGAIDFGGSHPFAYCLSVCLSVCLSFSLSVILSVFLSL